MHFPPYRLLLHWCPVFPHPGSHLTDKPGGNEENQMANEILRQQCRADEESAPGWHKHQCGACGTAWQHHKADLMGFCEAHNGEDDYIEAHTCPACGDEQWQIHYTPAEEEAAKAEWERKTAGMSNLQLLLYEVFGGER